MILLAWGAYKIHGNWSGNRGSGYASTVEQGPITGVAAAETSALNLSRADKAFVAELETNVATGRWDEVRKKIVTGTFEQRAHPIIKAVDAIAKVRLGGRGVELEREIMALEAQLRPVESDRPELLAGLRTARAELVLARSQNGDALLANLDLLFALLGRDPTSPRDIDVRIGISRAFFEAGEKLREQGDGYVRDDVAVLQQARYFEQIALKWVTLGSRWPELVEISPKSRVEQLRIIESIKTLNRAINGPSLPFSAADSLTWTGRRGDPIHSEPWEKR